MKKTCLLIALSLLTPWMLGCDDAKTDPKPEEASSAEAADAKKDDAKTNKASVKASGPFKEFGQFIIEAGGVVLAQARGDKVDTKWLTEAPEKTEPLKGAKHVFTTAEIEAMHETHGYVRTNVIVKPSGEVLWVGVEHRPGKAHVSATEGLADVSPELLATTKKLIETLSGDDCKLPLLDKDSAKDLPPAFSAQLKDIQPDLDKTCAAMKGKGEGWVPRYDDFTVVLEHEGKVRHVRSSIRVAEGKLKLSKPRLK